jgi:type VI secretion system protein ImpH
MAAASGNPHSPIEPPAAQKLLEDSPGAFNFFQAVRLLGRLLPERRPVGEFANPETETVRFGASSDVGFPPGQIASVQSAEDGQPRMRVNFMGLTGPNGVLPLYYSTLVRERLRAHDGAMRAFFDLFNHRAISLFYRAWEKHHFTVAYERGAGDCVSPRLLDLIGLGSPGLAGRQDTPDEALQFRCGLLAPRVRSAEALRSLLMDYFEVPVEIEQFVGAWRAIDEETQCRFTGAAVCSEQLGAGALVGDEIWDRQSGVRVRLGPLTLEQYRSFLPDGDAHRPLCSLIRFYAGTELEFQIQLVLRREETPACELGREGPSAPRLGWLSWARTAPMGRDPDDGILHIGTYE